LRHRRDDARPLQPDCQLAEQGPSGGTAGPDHRFRVPPGEVYQAVEGANGELGFFLVSDGSGRPYRVRVRPPCFFGMASLGDLLKGHMIADIITTFGMINMIGGECDR